MFHPSMKLVFVILSVFSVALYGFAQTSTIIPNRTLPSAFSSSGSGFGTIAGSGSIGMGSCSGFSSNSSWSSPISTPSLSSMNQLSGSSTLAASSKLTSPLSAFASPISTSLQIAESSSPFSGGLQPTGTGDNKAIDFQRKATNIRPSGLGISLPTPQFSNSSR